MILLFPKQVKIFSPKLLRGGVFIVFCVLIIKMKKFINAKYQDIISAENLLSAWQEFLNGKKQKPDVLEFQKNLMTNIFDLHNNLKNKTYTHGPYKAFNISDPKPRNIHKASVGDRLLHRAIYRILYPHFDKKFISDSYSCRLGKGTHRAMDRFRCFARKVSKNNIKQCWVLKCDIKKFFASVNHGIMLKILNEYVSDKNVIWLLGRIISSFNTKNKIGVGLPLGNLTSQLLTNIYMNEFDKWVKRRMKVKHYIRYADDFVILSQDKDYLLELTYKIGDFLEEELNLTLHPDKVFIKTFYSGIDFLGWIHFPNHRVLRTSTERRTLKALRESENLNKLCSYAGLLGHGNQFELKSEFFEKIKVIEEKEKMATN